MMIERRSSLSPRTVLVVSPSQSSNANSVLQKQAKSPIITTTTTTTTIRGRKNKNNNKNNKRVEFAMTGNLTIQAQFIEPIHELCDEIKSDTWWSAEEIKNKSLERKRLASDLRRKQELLEQTEDQQQQQEGFCALYKNCQSLKTFSQVMRTKAARQILFQARGIKNDEDRRGLEMSSLSKQLLKKRKHHVHAILSYKEKGAPDEILSVASAESSRASQILARVLAQMDKVAATEYNIE